MTVNSPSGSTLQCDTCRGSGMTCRRIRPVAARCNVTHSSGITTLNSPGGSTLQCGRWLWDDMPYGIRPNVRHIGILHLVSSLTVSPQSTCHSLCTSLRNFIQIGPPSAEKSDVTSIFKMADRRHLGL